MRKVVHLGGFFQAEYSMLKSFEANGAEIVFLYDDKTGSYFPKDALYNNYKVDTYVKTVSENALADFLKGYNPDVVIHRHYKLNPFMHRNAYKITSALGIPYGKYIMESDANDVVDTTDRFTDCDFLMYTHNIDVITNAIKSYDADKQSHCYFYPYGVGAFEKSIFELRQNRIGCFGYYRGTFSDRIANAETYVDAIRELGYKLHVYSPTKSKEGDWRRFKLANYLDIHPQYNFENATKIMNRYSVAVNIESLANLENMYSYKMFQSMGCGIPTLTWKRDCIEQLFGKSGEHVIMVSSKTNIKKWITTLMEDKKYRENLGKRCEKYMHDNFDWYKRFEVIMKSEKIWQ